VAFACREQLSIYNTLSILQIKIEKFLQKKVEKFLISGLDKIQYRVYKKKTLKKCPLFLLFCNVKLN